MKTEIKVGSIYKGLINGAIFKVIKKVTDTYSRSGFYFLVEFPQDKEQKPEYKRVYSESYLSHLLIEKIGETL
jgi:hypothetical protein